MEGYVITAHHSPTGASPFCAAQSRTPCLSFPVPQCCLSEGLLSLNFFVVWLAGARARKTYRCFPVFACGPGGLYGMISFTFFDFDPSAKEDEVTGIFVAIQ